MPIYEYQGQHYDIDITDPAEAKRKILMSQQPAESALQTFGRSAASLADTALGLPGAAVREAAYNVGRFVGQPEQQAAQMADKFLWNDQVGKLTGVTGTPGYENAPLRSAGKVIGEGIQQNVVRPVSEYTGLPEGDVASMVNSVMLAAGPVVPKVAGAVGRGAVNTVRGAVDVGQGVYGGFSGDVARPGARPRPGQQASARQPIGETYIPQEELARWRAGEVETPNLQTRPTSELPQKALARTGGTVPFEGQGLRAFGEQLGQDYRNPYKLGAEIAGDYFMAGVPTVARLGMKAYQGVQGVRAANELSRYGFTPLTTAEAAALKSGKPYPGGTVSGPVSPGSIPMPPAPMPPAQPQLGYSPEPTPTVIPMGGPGRRVNIEGESFNLPYQIDTGQAQTARPTMRPVSPAAVAQQMAAEKITPPTTPLQAAAQETVAQKAQRVMGDRYRAPVAEQPVTPIAPVEMAPVPAAATPVATAPVNTPAVKGLGMNTEPALAEKMSRVLPDEAFNRYSHFTPEQKQLLENYSKLSNNAERIKVIPQIEQIFGNVSAIEHPYQPGRPIGLSNALDPKLQDMYNRIQATKVVKPGPNQVTSWDYNVLTPAEVKDYYIKNYGKNEGEPKLKKGQTEEQYWDDLGKKRTVAQSIIVNVEKDLTTPTSLAVNQFKNLKYGTQSLPLSEAQANIIRSSEPSYTIHYRPTNMPALSNRAKQFAEEGGAHDYEKIGPIITERKGSSFKPEITDKKFNGILEQLGGRDVFNIKKEYGIGYNNIVGEEWIRPATATTPTYRIQQIEPNHHLGTKGYKLVEGDNMSGGKEIARVDPKEPKPKKGK